MLEETEIKLRVTPQVLTALTQHPLLSNRLDAGWRSFMLYNQYYDTDRLELDTAGVALRLRRDGAQVIQTLKSRGNSVAGLSVRNEWDWYLPQAALDLELLDSSCWPTDLAGLDKSGIQPVFTTDFTRTKGLLRWQWRGQEVSAEAALDSGAVVTAQGQEPICELELEMREGPVEALLELAVRLSTDVPLIPCDISKAERGYRLLDPERYPLTPEATDLGDNPSIDAVIATAGQQLLGQVQRLVEHARFAPDTPLLDRLSDTLMQLMGLFDAFDGALPMASQALFEPLIVYQLDQIHQARGQAAEAASLIDSLEQEPAWGYLCLRLLKWLLVREWQQERDEDGDLVGAEPYREWRESLAGRLAAKQYPALMDFLQEAVDG